MGLNPSFPTLVAEDLCLFLLAPCRFIDRGEFGEVYQGTAIDILGHETGPTPVAVKVRERLVYLQYKMCVCISCTARSVYSFFYHQVFHCLMALCVQLYIDLTALKLLVMSIYM